MKKSVVLLLAVLLTLPTFAGIKLPANCEVGLPSFLMKKSIKEAEVNALVKSGKWGQMNRARKYWVAYSDRSHNTTYNSPSSKGRKCDELEFNEQVRIAKIENGFALVYTEKQKGAIYPLISTNTQSRGWIPMNNLLLWGSCPTDEVGFHKIALVALFINELGDITSDGLLCYKNPETKDSPVRIVGGNKGYFVMKKDLNGMVLLAYENKMEGYTYQVLYGWVSHSSLVPWSHRTCIEPNWKPSVADELKGKRVAVYSNGKKVKDIEMGRMNNITQNPTTKYRLEPQQMRYPLLGDNPYNNKQYSIIAFMRPPGIHDDSMLKAVHGYTDKKDPQTGLDYWQPVIYITNDELKQLMEKLKPVMTAASTGNRKPYVDAMKEFVRSMIPNITSREMDEKDVKEIMCLVAGLNVKSGSLGGRTLAQIMNGNIVNDGEFSGMIADFQNKYRKLDKILSTKNDFSVERNKTVWYWIPVEDLPYSDN